MNLTTTPAHKSAAPAQPIDLQLTSALLPMEAARGARRQGKAAAAAVRCSVSRAQAPVTASADEPSDDELDEMLLSLYGHDSGKAEPQLSWGRGVALVMFDAPPHASAGVHLALRTLQKAGARLSDANDPRPPWAAFDVSSAQICGDGVNPQRLLQVMGALRQALVELKEPRVTVSVCRGRLEAELPQWQCLGTCEALLADTLQGQVVLSCGAASALIALGPDQVLALPNGRLGLKLGACHSAPAPERS